MRYRSKHHVADKRIPILYVAPWVDIGGSDTATVDWFRFLDRERFRPSLITTQPSPNRRLIEIAPFAEELWELPQLIAGDAFPRFILSFIHTRGIRLVHIMNSRLGFDLLPDVAGLPDRPRVVVQFHGEEPERAGYVRYVTTRYGNLVDAWSLTGSLASKRLDPYDVPAGKRHVIPIGVDAEREFSPERVQPTRGLTPEAFHILFPARLTAQKDPLLMVDVAATLSAAGLRVQLHVLGDGDMTDAVRGRVHAAGLDRDVLLHGAEANLAAWYAACDAVLLTSRYETSLPRAAYEAMAMEKPIIAPDLPELRELVTPGTGVLVSPQGDARAYADAIRALASDAPRRKAMGDEARARIRSGFSVQRMADEHKALYDELLEPACVAARTSETPASPSVVSVTGGFRSRRPRAKPLVSVVVTCFNQGRYLRGCLRSVACQTYEPIETILVDDGSADPETVAALDRIERERQATVLRLAANRGPSAARNAGIDLARGRYVLPLDGDDLLVDTAVADLVAQLGSAGERIGFIYPHLHFFGNRSDYLEMPAYNLHALLSANHCAVASLFDREVFDRGFRYAEEITLGDEDWDFALSLAEHGIYGEVARGRTVFCRKHGFTRSDLVEAQVPMRQVIAARHPRLFAAQALIKGEWNPTLTLIALDALSEPGETLADLVTVAANQTCLDFELIIRSRLEPGPTPLGPRLRRVSSELAASRAEALSHGLRASRGRYVFGAYGSPAELLADPALIEKTIRIMSANPVVAALALADSGKSLPPLRLLDSESAGGATLAALGWSTIASPAPPASLRLDGDRPLETLARWLGVHAAVQWRHLSGKGGVALGASSDGSGSALGAPPRRREHETRLRHAPAELPECPPGVPHRVASMTSWMPPQSRLLCRHRDDSGRYVYTNSMAAPAGCCLDHVLGCPRGFPFPGTASLVWTDRRSFAIGDPPNHSHGTLLGFLEQRPLPLLDQLLTGRDPATGQIVLVVALDDPLAAGLQEATLAGYIEPHPIRPRGPAHVNVVYGLIGLLRSVDLRNRRHRYAVGELPGGVAAGELGAMFVAPTGECDPLWIDEAGFVFAGSEVLTVCRPSVRSALQWSTDPLRWRRFSTVKPKFRATARRTLDSARVLASPPRRNGRPSQPAGYLLRSATVGTLPLYSALHPVNGDQLVTTDSAEANLLGYERVALLGHVVAQAPLTGKLGPSRPAAPWAARFGLVTLGQ